MNTNLRRLPLSLRLVAFAAALVAAPACAHVEPAHTVRSEALATTSGVRLGPSRTLSRTASLRHPVLLQATNGDVSATFAQHRGPARTVTLSLDTLESRGELEATLPSPAQAAAFAPYEGGRIASAELEDGRRLAVWHDERTGRVLGQLRTPKGAPIGQPFEVSRSADVVGSPVLATADGQRLVAAFFTSVGEGFELVAVALDVEAVGPRRSMEALREMLRTPPGAASVGGDSGLSSAMDSFGAGRGR